MGVVPFNVKARAREEGNTMAFLIDVQRPQRAGVVSSEAVEDLDHRRSGSYPSVYHVVGVLLAKDSRGHYNPNSLARVGPTREVMTK